MITSKFCSKDRPYCDNGSADVTVHGTLFHNLFSDELTKNKAAGSQREANLMKKCKCGVYPIIKQKVCERDLSREWICIKTLL